MFITFNEEESCHLQMGNNKVRDTFCLLHKLLTLQSIGIEGTGLTLEEQQKQPLEASLNDQLLVKGALNL